MRRVTWLLLVALLAATPALADGKGDFAAAYQAARSGDDERAAREYARAAESRDLPEATRAVADFNRGNALGRLGRHEEALSAYDRAIALTSDRAEFHLNRGIANRRLGRNEAAMADFDRALALAPDDPRAYNSRANAHYDAFRFDDALADYTKALGLDADYEIAERNQAIVARARDDYRAAMAKSDAGVKQRPESALAHIERGVARFNLGDFDGAAADFKTATEKEPDNAYGALWLYVAVERGGRDGAQRVGGLAREFDGAAWPAPVVDLMLRNESLDGVETLIADDDEKVRREKQCVLYFFAAQRLLLDGNRRGAAEMFRRTLATEVTEFLQYRAAEVELQRLAL